MNFEKIPGIWFVLSGVVYLVGLLACTASAPRNFALGFAAGGALVLVQCMGFGAKSQESRIPG